jgi:hypothetical protein
MANQKLPAAAGKLRARNQPPKQDGQQAAARLTEAAIKANVLAYQRPLATIQPGIAAQTLQPPPPVILEATTLTGSPFVNPAFDTSGPTWARDLTGGKTFLSPGGPPWEWTPVLDPTNEYDEQLVGLSGTVVSPEISGADNPFLHPFGFDFEFYIAPDTPYSNLVAPPTKPDAGYQAVVTHAVQDLGLDAPNGLLGVETDQGLVPPDYRVQEGDRIAVFGRWIVDAGHDDFHTEIHPPLLLAAARSFADLHCADGAPTTTHSTLVGRPYLISQEFGDGALLVHLLKEAAKVETFIPSSFRIEAHPRIFPIPFAGVHLLHYVVRPPSPRRLPKDALLASYHFTVRTGCAVQVYAFGTDAVGVIVVLNDAPYTSPVALPPRHDWSISESDLEKLNPDAASAYHDVIFASLLNPQLVPGSATAILSRGILTDQYDAPSASSSQDFLNVVTNAPIDTLGPNMGVSQDDSQPFPVYGWLNVGWDTHFCLGASLAGVKFPGAAIDLMK